MCLDELRGNWSPSLSIPKILETIRNLLVSPNVANALVSWIADLTIAHTKTAGVDTRYADAAKAHTATHAGEGGEHDRDAVERDTCRTVIYRLRFYH